MNRRAKCLFIVTIMISIARSSFCAMQFTTSLANGCTCQTLGTFGSKMNNGFTISFWTTQSSGAIATTTICGTINTGGVTALNVNFNRGAAQAFEAGSTEINLRDDSGNSYAPYIFANNLYDGNPHSLVFVMIKPSLNSAAIYLDGVSQPLLSGITQNPTTFSNFGFPWDIGAQNNRGAVNGPITGPLTDFRIYSRALSSAEAATIGQSREYVKITDSLIAEWPLDSGTINTNAAGANTVNDLSQNKFTCTPFLNPIYVAGPLNYP